MRAIVMILTALGAAALAYLYLGPMLMGTDSVTVERPGEVQAPAVQPEPDAAPPVPAPPAEPAMPSPATLPPDVRPDTAAQTEAAAEAIVAAAAAEQAARAAARAVEAAETDRIRAVIRDPAALEAALTAASVDRAVAIGVIDASSLTGPQKLEIKRALEKAGDPDTLQSVLDQIRAAPRP